MNINAKVICDSISPQGVRLTTLELCYHRFIHSEFMTHRMFSRNASSSRAIPIERVLEQVKNSPAMPIYWGKNQPGMQAREEHSNIKACKAAWKYTSGLATSAAQALADEGLHKQIVNRLLEPFQWIKVIVTATEWDNFFVLRLPYEELNDKQRAIADSWKERFKNNPDGKDAQPEIQELARCMKKAMEESTPVELKPGEWHLPYIDTKGMWWKSRHADPVDVLTEAIKCSVARCARVSYLNHDHSNPDVEKDVVLADKLLEAGHMSPFEHQATPMEYIEAETPIQDWEDGITHIDKKGHYWSGNFKGWIQYRNLI